MQTLLLLSVLWGVHPLLAFADCSDVLRPGELPSEVETPNGTRLTYTYQFENDETYSIVWSKGSITGGPIGPLPLQPSCKVPEVSEESNEFLLLEKACGGFCWYFDVLGISADGDSGTGTYEQIYYPLAFDRGRNLLAYYPRKDFIAIKNLLTGYEQIFTTPYECDTGSGLCFSDARITPDSLVYRWESSNGVDLGELLIEPLEDALLKHE